MLLKEKDQLEDSEEEIEVDSVEEAEEDSEEDSEVTMLETKEILLLFSVKMIRMPKKEPLEHSQEKKSLSDDSFK